MFKRHQLVQTSLSNRTCFGNLTTKLLLSFLLCLFCLPLLAKKPEFHLELKNHLFTPSEIEIPANKKVKLIIYNADSTPEEFDSFDLNREKVIFPHKTAVIFVGPLQAGRYKFFGEFNPHSAQGVVVVKPQSELKETKDKSNVN